MTDGIRTDKVRLHGQTDFENYGNSGGTSSSEAYRHSIVHSTASDPPERPDSGVVPYVLVSEGRLVHDYYVRLLSEESKDVLSSNYLPLIFDVSGEKPELIYESNVVTSPSILSRPSSAQTRSHRVGVRRRFSRARERHGIVEGNLSHSKRTSHLEISLSSLPQPPSQFICDQESGGSSSVSSSSLEVSTLQSSLSGSTVSVATSLSGANDISNVNQMSLRVKMFGLFEQYFSKFISSPDQARSLAGQLEHAICLRHTADLVFEPETQPMSSGNDALRAASICEPAAMDTLESEVNVHDDLKRKQREVSHGLWVQPISGNLCDADYRKQCRATLMALKHESHNLLRHNLRSGIWSPAEFACMDALEFSSQEVLDRVEKVRAESLASVVLPSPEDVAMSQGMLLRTRNGEQEAVYLHQGMGTDMLPHMTSIRNSSETIEEVQNALLSHHAMCSHEGASLLRLELQVSAANTPAASRPTSPCAERTALLPALHDDLTMIVLHDSMEADSEFSRDPDLLKAMLGEDSRISSKEPDLASRSGSSIADDAAVMESGSFVTEGSRIGWINSEEVALPSGTRVMVACAGDSRLPAHASLEAGKPSQDRAWRCRLHDVSIIHCALPITLLPIGGRPFNRKVCNLLGNDLRLTGRINPQDACKYLSGLVLSTSRDVFFFEMIAMPPPGVPTSHINEVWKRSDQLFQHFRSRERFGVLQLHTKDDSGGSQNVRDLYLIPLAPLDECPDFMDEFTHSFPTIRTKYSFIVVAVVTKSAVHGQAIQKKSKRRIVSVDPRLGRMNVARQSLISESIQPPTKKAMVIVLSDSDDEERELSEAGTEKEANPKFLPSHINCSRKIVSLLMDVG